MHTFNRWYAVYLIVLACGLLMLSGAAPTHGDSPPDNSDFTSGSAHRTVTRNGYDIYIFDSAEKQWRYARAWCFDPMKKQAALEALIEYFPGAKSICAEAELELAYLVLGPDYRFADRTACLKAIEKYRQIAARFSEMPAIGAKAHWYMGWIYADLLNQKDSALTHFQMIVSHYPDAALKREFSVPWVSLVLPHIVNEPRTVYERPVYSWRSMALLEIIRNTEDEGAKWAAFEKLWADDRTGPATGPALRHLLHGSRALRQKAAEFAQSYLHARLFSQPLAEEIRQVLYQADMDLRGGPGKRPQ